MPSFIVKKRATSSDGSVLGGLNQAVITAPDIKSAKEAGASQLGVSVAHVEAEPYGNPHWNELRQ